MAKELYVDLVDFMVSKGTKSTTEGNYCFYVTKLMELFNIPDKEYFYEHEDDILTELHLREEVADVEQEYIDGEIELYDVCFYLDFCPNCDVKEEDEEDI